MSRTGQQWERVPDLPATHFLDDRIFTDEQIFEDEKREIFRKTWLFVCHESEVAEKFDFRRARVADIELLITRGEDGSIRTFRNTCSHRGAIVERRPSGGAKAFTCLVHQWSYDTQGNCISITRGTEAYEGVGCSIEDFGLREVRTEVRLGLVFVNLDDESESIDNFFGDGLENVEPILGAGPLEVYHFHEQLIRSNWKHFQEISCEIYHANMHSINRRTHLRKPEYHDRRWKFYPRGHATMLGALIIDYGKQPGWKQERQGKPLRGLREREYRLLNMWPNASMVARDSACRFDTVIPISPDLCLAQFRAVGPKGEPTKDRLARYNDHNTLWGPFGFNVPEDNLATELQQEAMRGERCYNIIARDEEMKPMDEATLRNFYTEWERRTGRSASSPTNIAAE